VHTAPTLVALAALSAALMWSLLAQRRPPVPSSEAVGRASELIDPNSATPAQLEGLPGIGPAKARAIVTYRSRVPAPAFRSLEDLLHVPGIGPATLRRIRSYLFISPGQGDQG
jgi:competence ComEA-like helix-hairpin-helix protein